MNTSVATFEVGRANVRRHQQSDDVTAKPFLADAIVLRNRVRQHLNEARPATRYLTDRATLLTLLDDLLATALLCVLRCRRYPFMTSGVWAREIADDFAARRSEEQDYAEQLAERIFLLGGEPNFSPAGLVSRSQSAHLAGKSLIDLIKDDMLAVCMSMDSYRDVIHYLGNGEPHTRQVLAHILAAQEEHGAELADLLVSLPA